MGSYDAAVKVILAHCRQAALEYFLGLDVAESEILELPQETARFVGVTFPSECALLTEEFFWFCSKSKVIGNLKFRCAFWNTMRATG